MKRLPVLCLITVAFWSCHKNKATEPSVVHCDMQQVYADNAKKLTITHGIWGTIARTEGDCMPMVAPGVSTCKTCPLNTTIKIYEYTTTAQATPKNYSNFYDSFSTALIKEVSTDNNGFFQVDIPPGRYSVVIVENGKLYAFHFDVQGGISPVTFSGGLQNVDLTSTYKAVY